MNNLTSISGGSTPNGIAEAVRSFRKNLPLLIEHSVMMAELHWAKYEALKEQGFSDQQALELCKHVF